ncbi:MAG: hypothetical protein JSS15_03615, partial [Proteobacteria bacterium]|nr:hypothetical protein [Pseudomonadota bacterium]
MKIKVAMAAPSMVMAAVRGMAPAQARAAPAADAGSAVQSGGGVPDVVVTAN